MTRGKDAPRRRALRVPIRLAGSVAGRTARDVTVVDLSLTGCLVECGAPLDAGAILDLRFVIGDQPVAAKVRVAGTSLDGSAPPEDPPRYLAGLEFLGLPAQQESRLVRFLDEERRRRGAQASPQ